MKLRILCLVLLVMMVSTAACAQRDLFSYSGYVYILNSITNEYRWYALPDEGTADTMVQVNTPTEGGEVYTNIIRITHEGVYMESSNCDNQQCVGEGMVTLENMAFRVLGNGIYCLPHQITVQLYTQEEFYQWYMSNYAVRE